MGGTLLPLFSMLSGIAIAIVDSSSAIIVLPSVTVLRLNRICNTSKIRVAILANTPNLKPVNAVPKSTTPYLYSGPGKATSKKALKLTRLTKTFIGSLRYYLVAAYFITLSLLAVLINLGFYSIAKHAQLPIVRLQN